MFTSHKFSQSWPSFHCGSEVPEDFLDEKLPTLDVKTWPIESLEENAKRYLEACRPTAKSKTIDIDRITHTLRKRAPYVIIKRSAMSDNARYNILANELVRRLSIIKMEETSHEENEEVVEQFILQCKTSGSGWDKIFHFVATCGLNQLFCTFNVTKCLFFTFKSPFRGCILVFCSD